MYTVICADGRVRHEGSFATKDEARTFAEWGHACTNGHKIEAHTPLPGVPVIEGRLIEAQARLMSIRILNWLDTLNELAPEGYSYTCDTPGKRYVRIVMSARGHRSVHAFYDIKNGDVLKAAGWKAPAKIVRFNLLDTDSFDRMIEVCDWSGHYLYLR